MQIPGESIGIVADDLTGACDTALQFHAEGANTRILLDYASASQAASVQTWLVNTDSRHLEPLDAVAAVRKAVRLMHQTMGVDRFYKKIDSTLRGHIAQECLAVLDELKWQAAIIAPAFPAEGRRTVGGYQLVRGLPVGKTETALDPLFPIRESHLPTLLAKTSDPDLVGYVPLSKVMDGAGPILMALQEQMSQNKKLIVVDACSDVDLEQLSLAINKMPSDVNVLPCGSAGLAKALSHKWLVHKEQKPRPHLVIDNAPMLFVIGSASQVTRQQVQTLLKHVSEFDPNHPLRLFSLTPRQVLGIDPVDDLIQGVIQALAQQQNVILSTSYEEDSLRKTYILGEEHQILPTEASAKASALLARITKDVLSHASAKLLLSGGETANETCHALGTQSLQIIDQVEQSIPLMIDDQARWVITKSGGFGTPMSLLNIYRNLQELASPEEAQHA